jgi:hypothetical protein
MVKALELLPACGTPADPLRIDSFEQMPSLLDRDRLREVARLVDVGAQRMTAA